MSFLVALVSIFMAEVADKTMLITLSLSGQIKRSNLILGILLSSIFVMIIPIAVGAYLDRIFPLGTLSLASGIIFIIVGIFQLISSNEEEGKEVKRKMNEVLKAFIIFSLAELGDKTQIATFSLSIAIPNVLLIWLGATLGLFLPNLIVVLIGSEVLKRINQNILKIIAASIFLVIGTYMVISYFGWIPKVL